MMSRSPRVVFLAATLAAGLALVTGCSSAGRPQGLPRTSASVPAPQGVDDPAAVASGAVIGTECDPRASLRPAGALPAPGQMPAGSYMDTIRRNGRLVVGVDLNAFLFSYRDPGTGDLVGFDIDIAREIAKAIFGDPEAVQFRSVTTADRVKVVQDHSVDIVVRTFSSTCARRQLIDFSTEYLTTGQRLLVNRGSGYKSMDDMGGKKICASRGATSISVIQAAASHPIAVAAETTLDCLLLLQQGQVDAVSTIDVLLLGLAAQDASTEIVGPRTSEEPAAVGIAKDRPEFTRFVNAVLERIRQNGTWRAIYARWLSGLGPPPAPPVAHYID
jgi:polar amino acid transport system substrate-binding protein